MAKSALRGMSIGEENERSIIPIRSDISRFSRGTDVTPAPYPLETQPWSVRKFEPDMDFGVLAFMNIGPHNRGVRSLRDTETTQHEPPRPRLERPALFRRVNQCTRQRNSRRRCSAVRSTVTNYIEAYYTGNAARMQQTLHPHYLKHKIHGNIPVREQTGADLVQAARSGEGTHLTRAEGRE